MVVLQVDIANEDFDLLEVAPDNVCYTGTHDNDTTVGWFHGNPGDMRTDLEIKETQRAALQITGGMPETIHLDTIRAAFSTDARLAIAPLQDYLGLGSESRFNVPGTSSYNWRWRLKDSQLSSAVKAQVAAMVEESGRALQN
jgi:4-alpha-glucanotransferase